MADPIHVNPDLLSEQTAKIASLARDNKPQIKDTLPGSSGGSAGMLTGLAAELAAVVAQSCALMQKTDDLLTKTGTTFVEGDESMADAIIRPRNN